MRQVIQVYSFVAILGIMATTGVVLAASPWPEPETPACRVGVVTSHNLIPAVLAAYPERADATVDGYFAPVACADLGKRYTLRFGTDESLTLRAVDCAARSVGQWPQKGGYDWLGDVDVRLWPDGEPLAPLRVTLCEAP